MAPMTSLAHACDSPTDAEDRHTPFASQLFAAAGKIAAQLATGHRIDAKSLRAAMEGATGASDATGGWSWKHAYDVCEAAIVIFLGRYGAAMRARAGDPLARLVLLERLAQLLPAHTRRTEESQSLQQFSTPLAIAHAVAIAAAASETEIVLEPSAGLGILPALAGIDARRLHLNEVSAHRHALLARLFPHAGLSRHDAAQIDDRLDPSVRPTLIVMNPPFSAALNVHGKVQTTALRHIRSALARLASGGRLVAITGAGQGPHAPQWHDAWRDLQQTARVVFTQALAGEAYARNGTSFETRLTVIDKAPALEAGTFPPPRPMGSVQDVIEALLADLPPRLAILGGQAPLARLPSVGLSSRRPARTPAGFTPRPVDPVRPIDYLTHPWTPAADAASDAAGVYVPYTLQSLTITGAADHPTPLVQSVSMASVAPPRPSYRPHLPSRLVTDGALSAVQLESIIYAGEAHGALLPGCWNVDGTYDLVEAARDEDPGGARFRRGWFLGDGTGAGKGRQAAGVILDNWNQGRTKAVWVSKSDKLIEDAMRDWSALGQERLLISPQSRYSMGTAISLERGIVFTTYATLRSEGRQGKATRLEQLIEWLGRDFDGPVVFDEAHAMANAMGGSSGRGRAAPSQQGRAGLRLQRALPDARFLYVSATGATQVQNLAYAERLGLWGGPGAPFPTREEFVTAIETGEVAAMEALARDLKSMGLYAARSLSYEGVEYDLLVHDLTPAQTEIYDAYADAFQHIHHNLTAALEASGITEGGVTANAQAKSAARSAFESCKQRFFNHLITSMKIPSLIPAMQADLAAGHAPVVQIVSTGEALMERRLAQISAEEWNDLSIDITPREYVLDYLAHSFPTQLMEPYDTTEEGKVLSRPVFDADGDIVHCQAALAERDEAIAAIAMLPPVPGALDQILHHFGTEICAEVTGRSRRIVRRGERQQVENRAASANFGETSAFMDDAKPILIFSDAGGTGRSYHADLGCRNQRRRVHYLLEPGWRADAAIQGLGRTNRTNQVQPPLFRPVTTNVKGERRFISTIARRLDSLGAITKGQRETGGQNLFSPRDNLESDHARAALRQLFAIIVRGQLKGCSLAAFEDATALSLTDEMGLRDDLPPITQFLNRLLALRIAMQDLITDAFEGLLNARIEAAIANGSFDRGLEMITAESISVAARSTIYEHPGVDRPTQLLKLKVLELSNPTTLAAALRRAADYGGVLLINNQSGRVAVQVPSPAHTRDDGSIERRVRLVRPTEQPSISYEDLAKSQWTQTSPARFEAAWTAEVASVPTHRESFLHIVSGLLLPIWKRLPVDTPRVFRLTTDGGERIIGRLVPELWAASAADAIAAAPADPDEVWEALVNGARKIPLFDDLSLRRCFVSSHSRIELEGAAPSALAGLKAMGLFSEIIQWKLRLFIPNDESGRHILAALLVRHPVSAS
jgi:hypothetical protein